MKKVNCYLRILCITMVVCMFHSSSIASFVLQDDFATDTTGDYISYHWPYRGNTTEATVTFDYDATNERAVLKAVGGYGWTLLTKSDAIVDAGRDFEFSCDFKTLQEYNGALYLGDMRPTNSGSYIRLRLDTYWVGGKEIIVQKSVDGVETTLHRISYNSNSANLKIIRENSIYKFYYNDINFFETAINEFDSMSLNYGVQNVISSGPSGWTARTEIDNLIMVPEPATLSLLALGGLVLRRKRKA